jgi:hypothetical protein
VNIWDSSEYYPGQPVICAYNDCKKKFHKVSCPHCQRLNIFSDFFFGKNYNCIYEDCKKEFSRLICPGCNASVFLKNKTNEGSAVTCNVCKMQFRNMRCPHCMETFFDVGGKYKYGHTIQCPNPNCKKSFNQLHCIHCQRIVNYKNNNYREGEISICPYNDCKKKYIYGYCGACERVLQVFAPDSSLLNKAITCCYDDCKKTVCMKGNDKTLFKGQRLIFTQGATYFFDHPKKDPIEIKVLKSMVRINAYDVGNFASVNEQGKDDSWAKTSSGIFY